MGALEFAAEELSMDSEVDISSLGQSLSRTKYLGEHPSGHRKVVLTRKDREAFLARKASFPNLSDSALEALQYAAEELRKDREAVLEAVSLDHGASENAAEELRRDREVALTAFGHG